MQEASINLFSDKQITLPSNWMEELSFETTVGDANVLLLGFTDIIGYEADSLDVLHADNSGHTFFEILNNQLQALAIVFNNIASKAFIQKDNVDTRLFSQR